MAKFKAIIQVRGGRVLNVITNGEAEVHVVDDHTTHGRAVKFEHIEVNNPTFDAKLLDYGGESDA